MKKVQTIDAFRGIQKRFVSFLSIVIIVLIGAGAYLLTSSISQGLKKTGDEYYHDLNYMDLQMISSLGITDQQINQLEKVEGVEAIEGIIQLDGKVGVAKDMSNVILLTTTRKINMPDMLQGRIPVNDKECAIPNDFAILKNLKLNDTVKISSSFNDEIALVNSDVRIVGIYNHPNYIRKNAAYAVLIDRSLLNEDLFNNIYNRVYVTQKDNNINAFNDAYFEHQKQLKDELYSMKSLLEKSSIENAKQLGNKKIDEMESEAYTQINDAQKQIDDSKAKLEKELSSALAKINSSQAQLDASYNQLVSAQSQVESGEALLRQKEAEYLATTARLKKYHLTAEDLIALCQKALVILNDLDTFMDNPIFDGEFTREYAQMLIDKLNNLIDYIEDNIESRIIAIIEEVFPQAAQSAKEYLDSLVAFARNLIAYLEENMDDFIDGTNKRFRELFEEVRFNVRYLIRTFNQAIKYANEYISAPEQIELGWQKIADAKWQISDGWIKYEDGKNRLNSARTEYAIAKKENEAKIIDAQKQLDDKKKEVDEQIADARKQLENLKCNWVITDRHAELTYKNI